MSNILHALLRSQDSADNFRDINTSNLADPGENNPRARQAKRTKYIGRACQNCQRRKVKCSGDDICNHCRARGTPCIYTRGARRGRPQRKEKRSKGVRVPVAARQVSPQQSLRETRHDLESPNDTDRIRDICDSLSPTIDEAHIPEALDEEETDTYDILETRPRSISLASQLQSLRDLVSLDRRQQMPTTRPSRPPPLLCRVIAVELPPLTRLKTLLDVYFHDVDSYFPFIEKERTEVRILQALTRIGYGEHQHIVDVDFQCHSTIALLCNMLAVAECFCASERPLADVRPGWSMFVWGRKVLQYCSSHKCVDLDLIRYHALGAEYLMQSEMLQAASQTISNAAQLAMLIRLSDQRAWKQLPEHEVHDRKALWWVLYFLDRKIAQRIGGPYCIRENEMAVSEFDFGLPLESPRVRTQNYIQALANLAKLWTRIWDSFFSTAAPKPADSREIEVMDTRILVAQRELPGELTWDTDLLDNTYIFQGETEPQIRRRLSIFIRLNLLRLTIRQNPLHKTDQNPRSQCLRVSLASQVTVAIAAFADSIANIEPCGFFFSTALVECIYHLIFAIQRNPHEAERTSGVDPLKRSYQLLVRFSRTLDTAKRAIRALGLAMSTPSVHDADTSNVDQSNGMLLNTIDPIGIDASHSNSTAQQHYGPLEDMSLFDFLDGAAEDFQYNNVQDQILPDIGSGLGLWNVLHCDLDGTST